MIGLQVMMTKQVLLVLCFTLEMQLSIGVQRSSQLVHYQAEYDTTASCVFHVV